MSLWVIVPIKPLNRAKSRLSAVLSAERRFEFAQVMLKHVLEVATSVPQVTGTLVISRDTKALAIARDFGARTVQESGESNLNAALSRATEVVRVWGAEAILVLPADLPFLRSEDIRGIIQLGMDPSTVVIAADVLEDGTNALMVRPPGLIGYHYGPHSYTLHLEAAEKAGASIRSYSSASLMLDVDVPHDLDEYNNLVMQNEQSLLPPFWPDIQLSHGD